MLKLHSCRKGAVSLALALPPLFLGADEASCAFLGDVFKPFVALSESYDSNVFRVQDTDQLRALVGDDQMGDFYTTAEIGAALHYTISQQAIDLMAKRDFVRYSHYTGENADDDEVTGKLSLRLLTKWTLNIDGSYTNAPEPRTDFTAPEQNVKTNYSYGFLAGYQLPLGLTLQGGYHRREVDYSLETYASSQYKADVFDGTLSYQISPTAKVYGTYQHDSRSFQEGEVVDGESLKRDNTGDSFRVGVEKSVSPRTALAAYLGYLDRRYDEIPARNFSGMIAELQGGYALTAKTQLVVSGERQIYEETYSEWFYSVTNIISLGANYQATEKVKGTLLERLMWKDYEALPGFSSRSDFINETTVGVEYNPINRLYLDLNYVYSSRSSDVDGFDFTDHLVTASIAYRY